MLLASNWFPLVPEPREPRNQPQNPCPIYDRFPPTPDSQILVPLESGTGNQEPGFSCIPGVSIMMAGPAAASARALRFASGLARRRLSRSEDKGGSGKPKSLSFRYCAFFRSTGPA